MSDIADTVNKESRRKSFNTGVYRVVVAVLFLSALGHILSIFQPETAVSQADAKRENASSQDTSPDAQANVMTAHKVCALMDSTGLTSKTCSVSGWSSSVDVTIDMTSTEARDLCYKVSGWLSDEGVAFGAGWQMRIYSPYNGGKEIAYCSLS